VNSPPLSVPVGSSPVEPKAIDSKQLIQSILILHYLILDLIYTQAYVNQQEELYRAAKKSKKQKSRLFIILFLSNFIILFFSRLSTISSNKCWSC
jgi:hypothetical protein